MTAFARLRVPVFLLSVVFFFCSLIIFLFAYGPHVWGPRIACDAAVFDFGQAPTDQTIDHGFVIHNSGWRTLLIAEVAPGCGGCLQIVGTAPQAIAPRCSDTIRVSLPLAGLRGQTRKSIMVRTNDPLRPAVFLYIQGIVLPDDQAQGSGDRLSQGAQGGTR